MACNTNSIRSGATDETGSNVRRAGDPLTAVKIDRYPDGEENTSKLVISLPKEKAARKKLFGWAADRAEEQGYDPEPDVGQKDLFVMLD
jgi:hypothetical protein